FEPAVKPGELKDLLACLGQATEFDRAALLAEKVGQVKQRSKPGRVEGVAAIHLQHHTNLPSLGRALERVREEMGGVVGQLVGRMGGEHISECFSEDLHGGVRSLSAPSSVLLRCGFVLSW